MSADPSSSAFEGVAVVRLRPLFFVLVALILAVLVAFGWGWWVDRWLDAARSAERAARLGVVMNTPPGSLGLTILLRMLSLPLVCFPGLLALSRASSMKRDVPADIGVRDDHLLVDGHVVTPLASISSAFIVSGAGEARTVRIERPRRPAIELRVRDEGHAAALMRALGLGPTEWAASYPLPFQSGDPWGYLPSVLLACGVLAALSLVEHGSFLAGLCWSVRVPVAAALRPRLLVGTDGISLVRMRRTRFVSYDEIAGVEAGAAGKASAITIALTTGKTLELDAEGAEQARRIAERIHEAKAAAASEVDTHPALLRSSGPPRDRIRALRALGREEKEGYRVAPLSTEQLWRIFESGTTDSEARAGAAIALRERLDASCQRRLRVVAAATAEPKLRAAIESAARDDDASLEEALAALDFDVEEEQAVQRVEAR